MCVERLQDISEADAKAEGVSMPDGIKTGEIKPSEAAELANLAGKMIASAKVQVEYYALRKESPEIGFLKDDARRAGEEAMRKMFGGGECAT